MIKATMTWILALWLLLPAAAGAQSAAPRSAEGSLADGAGVIQSLDFAASTVTIDGVRYAVAVDAKVEIAGGPGAFTLLAPGMKVHFEYLLFSAAERRITLIRVLPGHVRLDQV